MLQKIPLGIKENMEKVYQKFNFSFKIVLNKKSCIMLKLRRIKKQSLEISKSIFSKCLNVCGKHEI